MFSVFEDQNVVIYFIRYVVGNNEFGVVDYERFFKMFSFFEEFVRMYRDDIIIIVVQFNFYVVGVY